MVIIGTFLRENVIIAAVCHRHADRGTCLDPVVNPLYLLAILIATPIAMLPPYTFYNAPLTTTAKAPAFLPSPVFFLCVSPFLFFSFPFRGSQEKISFPRLAT